MARVFYLGAPSHVNLPNNTPVSDLLKATYDNTGNLLIGHALKRVLKIDSLGSDISRDPKYIEENFDYIIIGAANFLYKRFDFIHVANFLEKVHLPCVIIGLGAQAPNYDSEVEIPDGTKRMIEIISERSTTLGVRGNFTAAVLEKMGFKNVRIIGCPAMYWTCKPAIYLSLKPFDRCEKIAVTGSANTVEHMNDVNVGRRVEASLGELAHKNNYPYILQNESVAMSIVFGEELANEENLILSLKIRYGLSHISDEEFILFVKNNMIAFFDIEEWVNYISSFDFMLGSRFHGCLIALLNGVPSTIFVIDARTQEMCEILNIPHIDIRNLGDIIDIRLLYESMDLDSLQKTYSAQYLKYIDFLEENGIEHCLERPA